MNFKPTEQQKKVISHHLGHARVLAIAGSGKTTTMVHRIKKLISEHGVNPKKIRVLMFNSDASTDFKKKIKKVLDGTLPYISTFHSFSYQFIENAIQKGMLPKYDYWIAEHEFEIDKLIHKIIADLESKEKIEKGKVELDEVRTSISLWKGSLIKPENAGHIFNNDIVAVFKEFEKRRTEQNILTFDDFIPLTIELLSTNISCKQQWLNRIEHFIIDEYQDINLSQQKLIELLAGENANLMVVGDDDQTIYEWRGARPDYILKEFQTTFTSKPHSTFKLDETFRFGPILAQCAQNTIAQNSTRHSKNVFANKEQDKAYKPTSIEILKSDAEHFFETNEELTKIVKKLVIEDNVSPKEIRVIGRLYSQLTGIESWFIKSKVPYKIEGNIPFFKRREVSILLDYIFLIENLYENINVEIRKSFLGIVNTPNRKISKKRIESSLYKNKGIPLIDFLETYSNEDPKLNDFSSMLIAGNALYSEMYKEENIYIDFLITWVYETSKLEEHYLNYYGEGEKSINKISTTQGFISYTSNLKFSPTELIKHIKNLDSTRGATEDKLIIMSTVHKTKGLEYDYVLIPDCNEGSMPYISDNQISIFDKEKPESITNLSDSLENERRLFYVAITRAKKLVLIGSVTNDKNKSSRFLEEIFLKQTKSVLLPIVKGEDLNLSWLEKVKQIGGRKSIIENIRKYLNKIGHPEIIPKVDYLTMDLPEDEFSYKNAYSSKTNIKKEEKKDSNDPWNEVRI